MPVHVEVLRDPLGKPYVKLYEGAAKKAEDLGIRKIEVSISDTKDHAMAFAVGEEMPDESSSQWKRNESI